MMYSLNIFFISACYANLNNKPVESDSVLGQYVEFPYPEFKEIHMEAEKSHYALLDREGPYMVVPDLTLENLNHYLYNGEEGFENNFRVLIAGGGIGDTTMFLAEQLNHTNADIVYLDFSHASMKIAKGRAELRNLKNIIFINDRIENIPNLHLGSFDLIDSYGVLHHLKDPQKALKILQGCLKESGGMTIMFYAKYGRTGVYNMQSLQQLVNDEAKSRKEEVVNAWKILNMLPSTNLFKRTEHLTPDHLRSGDAGLYDLLLHKQDQAYSMPEMVDMISKSDLHFVEFAEPDSRLSMNYRWFVKDKSLLDVLGHIPEIDQLAVGELMSGGVLKHSYYLSKSKREKEYLTNLDKKLCFMGKLDVFQQFLSIKENKFGKMKNSAVNFLDSIQSHLNCTWSIKEMFSAINSKMTTNTSNEVLLTDLKIFYNFASDIGQLLVRNKEIKPSPLSVKYKELFDRFYTLY